MKISGKTDIGKKRAENQDTFRSGNLPGTGAWGVVCDGMGGAYNGKLASAVAADCMEEMLYQQMEKPVAGVGPHTMLRRAIELANAEVFERSGEDNCMMGTTVVCALIRKNTLHLAHVGDSRAYLHTSGMLHQLTRDHSMVQEMVEAGKLTSEQAKNHPEKNVITRALGVDPKVEPSFSEWDFEPGDTLLLCTDGLTNMVQPKRINEIMNTVNFWDIPRELVSAALKAGGEDNITVLIMRRDDVKPAEK